MLLSGEVRIQIHLCLALKSLFLLLPPTTEDSENLGTGTMHPQHTVGIQHMFAE